jgi:Domain of unknown function (DUF6438)
LSPTNESSAVICFPLEDSFISPDAPIWKKCSLLWLVPTLLALSCAHPRQKFQPSEGVLVAGLRETERHRAPLPELRIGWFRGSPENVTFWVHLDSQGRVLEVRDVKTDYASFPFVYRRDAVVEAVSKITYRPFLHEGVAVEAWVQDQAEVGTESAKPPSPRAGTFPTLLEPTGFSIRLSRSACFGSCPSYSVVIHGDGNIEFHGEHYVAMPGNHQARISPEAVARLLERFRAAQFFEFKDKYVASVTDNPTYCLELAIGAKKKTITDYVGTWVGMPTIVSELEDAVDEAAGTDRWVSAGPGTLAAMQAAGIAPNSERAGEILVHAVESGKGEAVRSLLLAGAPVRHSGANHSDMSLLTATSYIRDRESQQAVFKALLENAEVRADKAGIQDALGRVAGEGNVEVARMLIAAGADPRQLFRERHQSVGTPDQTYLMRAAASGVWEMLDDALSRPHDIHAVDSQGRSAVGHVLWSAPPMEYIFPLVDRLLAVGADKAELTRALADVCDFPQWHDGLVKRGADPTVCRKAK